VSHRTPLFRRIGRFLLKGAVVLWAAPGTAVGLCLGALAVAFGGRCQWVRGALEFYGGPIPGVLGDRVGAIAITFGHTILGLDRTILDSVRTHEHVHVQQYERWGPLFLPAYIACSAWLKLTGGHPYLDNPFEVEAFRKDGSGRRPDTSRG
jgi:hypothetical protein